MYCKRCWPLFVLLVLSQVACDEPPEIRQYRVEKSRSDLGDMGLIVPPSATAQNPAAPKSVPSRMVVAIAERDDATWFFKLTGPIAAVASLESNWTALLAGISFGDDGRPDWGTAEGWEVGPDKPMRTATLLRDVENEGQVELSISSLGPNQDLLLNVNRWLGQLGNPTIKQDELDLETLETAGGKMKMFDSTGELATGSGMGMMRSGMGMGGNMGMKLPGMQNPAVQPPGETELAFDVPAGWTKGSSNSIVKVRLRKGDKETSPQITVTQLLAGANKWIPNAQRWAQQADMDDSEAAVKELSSELTVDDLAGDKIRLIPEDESKPYGLVGIMVVRGELAWFFKLIGDREQVIACEADFDSFINSFRFQR